MKSLNDSLREEFSEILNESDHRQYVKEKNLDIDLINKAFERLLSNKTGNDESIIIEQGRAEFETYIINTLKTKAH